MSANPIYTRHHSLNCGFTLVELAIVMTIIGLLIGGILKGQELINNAGIKATVQQVQGYRAAYETFHDIYNSIPGDMVNATSRIPNCTAANNCYNGNGDGMVGMMTDNFSHDDQSATTALPQLETTMFWKHLADANLISGINISADPLKPAWGETHPAAKFNGGFHTLLTNETGDNAASGMYFMLHLTAAGDPNPGPNNPAVLTSVQAQSIDIKFDDGNGKTGTIHVDDGGNRCTAATTGVYYNRTDKACLMIFNLN
ncbi:MAG: prepilin-type N-terminal cleavage/methylation domain-containing protein [Micavibrio sp.]|nr:prepilin-type N-terminal cleavage/methylation domain-containing protein [Micavibrio sp.]